MPATITETSPCTMPSFGGTLTWPWFDPVKSLFSIDTNNTTCTSYWWKTEPMSTVKTNMERRRLISSLPEIPVSRLN